MVLKRWNEGGIVYMKIGMNLLLWTDAPSAEKHAKLIETIRGWGFDGVEFPLPLADAKDTRAFSNLCDNLGLGRTTILALNAAEADPASESPQLRANAIEAIRKAAEQTKEIGADILAGPLFQGLGRFTGRGPTETEWHRAVETIHAAAEHAASIGVRIALEPLNRFEMYIVNTIGDAVRFVQDVGLPNVGLLADTHHANIEENDTAAAWKAAGRHIFHVHISENHRGAPGSGQGIPPSVFTALREMRYDGWLTIEAFGAGVPGIVSRLHLWRPPDIGEEEIARRGLAFIRQSLAASEV